MEERHITIDGLNVHYKIAGQGQPILILHGWGVGSDSWIRVQELLSKKYLVVVPDLPGFGKTPSPPVGWSLDRYVDFTESFQRELNLESLILLGHSFGGRIAIAYAVKYPEKLSRLILCAAAGIRHMRLRHKVFLVIAKVANLVATLPGIRGYRTRVRTLFYRAIGRTDYMKTEGVMKEVFLSTLSRNLKPLLSSIKTPTVILWGEEDDFVGVEDAYTMGKSIPGAKLVVFPGVGHSPHKTIPEELVKKIEAFLAS